MSKDEMTSKIDRIVSAFGDLNTALWEHEDADEIEALIGFLERELKVMRRSLKLLRA